MLNLSQLWSVGEFLVAPGSFWCDPPGLLADDKISRVTLCLSCPDLELAFFPETLVSSLSKSCVWVFSLCSVPRLKLLGTVGMTMTAS